MSKLNYGDRAAREVSGRIGAPVASLTELKAIPFDHRVLGMRILNLADGSRWRFHDTSALAGDDILVAAPSAGAGRWLRELGQNQLRIPIGFATADAAILLTLGAGCLLEFGRFRWEVTADFTGGASSAIGVSSSTVAGHTTKGDLLGGATGDVAATLVAASGLAANGTIGAQWGTLALRDVVWKPTDTLRFDRITSIFTAGAGFLIAPCNILRHDGA